jgi:hypothetical protein
VIIGKLALAKLSRINERQADLLATDILGEKKSMLAVCEEVSKHCCSHSLGDANRGGFFARRRGPLAVEL